MGYEIRHWNLPKSDSRFQFVISKTLYNEKLTGLA